VPKASFFSLLSKRYLKCHNLPPEGVTIRNSPPPSKILYGLFPGLAVQIFTSEMGVILFGMAAFLPILGACYLHWGLFMGKSAPKTAGF
jgi:hypothetical protein